MMSQEIRPATQENKELDELFAQAVKNDVWSFEYKGRQYWRGVSVNPVPEEEGKE